MGKILINILWFGAGFGASSMYFLPRLGSLKREEDSKMIEKLNNLWNDPKMREYKENNL